MGRPCVCSCRLDVDPEDPCAGSDPPPWCHPCSGGEFGTDEIPAWCDPCSSSNPPSYCTGDPVPTSGTGPWKVYVAGGPTSGVLGMSTFPNNTYIHSFATEPIIKAFGVSCVLAMEVRAGLSTAVGNGDAIVFDGETTYSISGILATASGYQINPILEVGDTFIQGFGFRINRHGAYWDDDWWQWGTGIYGDIRRMIALDGRSFLYANGSGLAESVGYTSDDYIDQIYSMGTNFLGKIARDGGHYHSEGTSVTDWVPREIDQPAYNVFGYTFDNHVFWPNGGGFHSWLDYQRPDHPDNHINMFGEAVSAGHVHGRYIFTTPPKWVVPPSDKFYAECGIDNWLEPLAYGSVWVNGYNLSVSTSSSTGSDMDVNMQAKKDIAGFAGWDITGPSTNVTAPVGGGRVQMEQDVPPEALVAHFNDGSQLVTSYCWGRRSGISAEGIPCPWPQLGAQLITIEPQWSYLSSPGDWEGEVTKFEFDLNLSGIPYRRLFTSGCFGVGKNGGGPEHYDNPGVINSNSDPNGPPNFKSIRGSLTSDQLAWSHPEQNWFRMKFTPVHELVGGESGVPSYPFWSGAFYYIPDSENFYWAESGVGLTGRDVLRTSGVRIAMVGNASCDSAKYHPPQTINHSHHRGESWSMYGGAWISMFSQSSGVLKMLIPPNGDTLLYIQYNDEEPNYTNTSGVPASGRRYFSN